MQLHELRNIGNLKQREGNIMVIESNGKQCAIRTIATMKKSFLRMFYCSGQSGLLCHKAIAAEWQAVSLLNDYSKSSQ